MTFRRVITGVAGAATMIAVLTIISRVLGFGRWLVQAGTVQAGAVGNAYATANTVPNVLYEVAAGGALAGAVIPLLASPIAKRGREEVNRIASALLCWALAVLVPLAIIVSVFARPIASAFPQSANGDPVAQVDMTTYFLLVFAPQIVLYGIGVVLTGVLQAHRRFLMPALAPIASTVIVIASYLIFGALANGMQDQPGKLSDASLAWLAWGTTAGVAVMSLPLAIPVFRLGVRFKPTFRFPPGVARRAAGLAMAGIGSLLAQQVSVIVVVWLARDGGLEGTINIFQWSQAVYLLPYAVLAIPLATAIFPKLSELASHGRNGVLAVMTQSSTRAVIAVSVLGAAALIAAAPAAEVIFSQRNDTTGMTLGLTLMAPGVIGLALIFHLSRALYAIDRHRAAVAASACGWGAVTVVAIIAVKIAAPNGGDQPATLAMLGLAHTVGMTVAGIALLLAVRRCLPAAVTVHTLRTVGVSLTGGIVGAVVGRWASELVLDMAGTSVLAGVMAGALGALIAAGCVSVGVVLSDRGILSTLRRTRA